MRLYIFFIIGFASSVFSQANPFTSAYQQIPELPKGVLEALAYTNTRMQVIDDQETPSCSGQVLPYGIMGLFENGGDYFIENGAIIAKLSGISIPLQKLNKQQQILAYGMALHTLLGNKTNEEMREDPSIIGNALLHLTEIPEEGMINQFARQSFLLEVFRFLNNEEHAENYNFDVYKFNLSAYFGAENYRVLVAKKIRIAPAQISTSSGDLFTKNNSKSLEYGPAIWNPAPPCNISSRNGIPVSAITIHTVQGTYAGAISWSQNCNSNVSYHYVVRSSDGQVTQMVLEAKKAWHVASENPYTIGYEHEGYVSNAAWYTQAMYEGSANLSKDIINSSYGIIGKRTYDGPSSSVTNVLGACIKIKGHQHFLNQTHTDPGIFWNWEKYYQLINVTPNITHLNLPSGTLYDSGGATGNYGDDERLLYLIQPNNAATIQINFTNFSLENNFDHLIVYDGADASAPVIANLTGNALPASIQSTGPSLLIDFRSDCAQNFSGYALNYNSTPSNNDQTAPITTILPGNLWDTVDFQVNITDTDTGDGVANAFYLLGDKNPNEISWRANGSLGFVCELFDDQNINWTNQTGVFNTLSGAFQMNDVGQNNSNAYLNVNQNNQSEYLFEWEQKIVSSNLNQRAGMHFFCSDPTLPNRGNSYFIYLREETDKIQIYKVTNDVFTIVNETPFTNIPLINYHLKVHYNPSNGWIKVYIDNDLISQWQDPSPIQTGTAISLRSGACSVVFDKIRVFLSRGSIINIGLGNNQSFRYESQQSAPAGILFSQIIDNNENWSNEKQETYLIDWSAPVIDFCNDGVSFDVDSTILTYLDANWLGTDPNSMINQYYWSLGTLPGIADITNWTNGFLNNGVQHLLANPIDNQVYYFNLKAINKAGIISIMSSDGQKLYQNVNSNPLEDEFNPLVLFPNPCKKDGFYIKGVVKSLIISVFDEQGRFLIQHNINNDGFVSLPSIASGAYSILIEIDGVYHLKKLIVE
jgi:hypothetical protein